MQGELITIIRTDRNDVQTLGEGVVTDTTLNALYTFKTLELPWENNQRNVSCIPKGIYKAKKRYSQKFKHHIHITGVPGRSYILIHPGNYYTQIRGCILPGQEHRDINRDGLKDVVGSGDTLDQLLDLMPDEFHVNVTEQL